MLRALPFTFLAGLVAPALAWACLSAGDPALFGTYDYVTSRQASDVAATADWAASPPVSAISMGEAGLVWHDGSQCSTGWSSVKRDAPTINGHDPILADSQILPARDGAPDARTNQGYDIVCGQTLVGRLTRIDGRVIAVSSANGASIHLFQKELSKDERNRISDALNRFKFLETSAPDADTLNRALGFYLDYRGVPYRFAAPVITENLMEDLK